MKFLHLSDLHLGKSIYGVSLIESGDQPHLIQELVRLVAELRPDAVVVAGDIYDRSAPSGDAVALLSQMLTEIVEMDIPVLMVSGNHDSGQRLSFAGDLLAKQKLFIAGTQSKEISRVTIQRINFWLVPYLFPMQIAQLFEDDTIRDYDTAMRRLLERQNIDFSQKNVLVAHQNVVETGVNHEHGGSESMVGDVGQIEYTAFDGFDYVALGHIHAAYPVGRPGVRYCGTPMCYHFSETKQAEKGPLLVELDENGGESTVTRYQIQPLHPMRELGGALEEIRHDAETTEKRNEYLRIVMTDQKLNPVTAEEIRSLYGTKDSLVLEFTSIYQEFFDVSEVKSVGSAEKSVEALFADFYQERSRDESPSEDDMELFRFVGELVRNPDTNAAHKKEKEVSDKEVDAILSFLRKQEGERI